MYNTTTPTVRLLRLQKTQSGSIISWLEPFSLNDPKCPQFTTLSYVWGTKKYSHKIAINGHTFPILKSLYPILEVICEDEKLREDWWWIDSICIDQGMEERAEVERNAQVHLMRTIFEKSESTMGWLGQGKEEGEEGMKFLRILSRNLERLTEQKGQERKELGEELRDRKKWAAVERLLLRPWWTRVWTLQEYIVAHKFIFYCGKESMDRDGLSLATCAIYLCAKIDETLISRRAFEGAWIRRRLLMWYQERTPMQLFGLMAYVGDYKATDPRDRIYSLLGLAQDRFLADPPRYQDHVDKVYSELVKSFVQHYNSLDVICLTDRFNRYIVQPAIQPALPSWVPDWRAVVVPCAVPMMACQSAVRHIGNFRPLSEKGVNPISYAAGRSEGPLRVSFSADLQILTCQGIMIDFFDGIGGLKVVHRDRDENEKDWDKLHDCVHSTSPVNIPMAITATNNSLRQNKVNPDHASKLMEHVARCLLLNRKDRYLNYEILLGYFYGDFQGLCLSAIETPAKLHPQFLDWFRRNKSLYIQRHSLEEICKTAETLENSRQINFQDVSDQNSFLSRFKDTTEWMVRRLITTNQGHIGMVPCRVQKGDQIWVLLGCSIPLVLKKCEGKQTYQVIGECYLHGYMTGEVLEDLRSGKVKVEDIQLL